MQFITGGPDIPNTLVQAHEEGRVVFFCGAGISYPAGLPGFEGLVEEIYRRCGTHFEENEQEAFNRGKFDTTLDLLEHRLPGQRLRVRYELANALKPKLRRKGATDTQEALLRLATDRNGSLRMVTTNFDRIFHAAAKRIKQPFQSYSAPMLPIPKNSRWDGLVYLHGVLPSKKDDTALNRLVITSGDFGLAYLTERWASRFVSDLFRNYVVCFVGYSINDPVLRYMMDALAADRMLGENTPQAWALGDCAPGQEHAKTIEWESKGVKPILYTVPTDTKDHSALHKTLQAWADTYRDGVQGKEAIVVKHALTQPQESTPQDDFVGRMLWALSDTNGLPAKRFADFNPAPPLDWLFEAFALWNLGSNNLSSFGVQPFESADTNQTYSFIHRPPPPQLSSNMALVYSQSSASQFDDVMHHLARWLIRHLNDPRLIIWIANNGGKLHHQWAWMIERQLAYIHQLEKQGKTDTLDEIRSQSPMAIPNHLTKVLWNLLLSNRVQSSNNQLDFHNWQERLEQNGMTTTSRLELRELLSPKVTFKSPFRWNEDDSANEPSPPLFMRDIVDYEIVLNTDIPRTHDKKSAPHWEETLPSLVEEFQQLLRDALDLRQELGDCDEKNDGSNWDLPSISPHNQNRGYQQWVTLIELLRDSWLSLSKLDKTRSARIALEWFRLPYPTFKRLSLFAATQNDLIETNQWVEWLLRDRAWWLWSLETEREMFRLLVLRGKQLGDTDKSRLEQAICIGPLREMFKSDLDNESWNMIVTRSVWLRLAKLESSGLELSNQAKTRLDNISSAYQHWKLADDEKDEFSSWMSTDDEPNYEEIQEIKLAPRKRKDLITWLTKPPSTSWRSHRNGWDNVCRTRFFHSLCALHDLAKTQIWPIKYWNDAFHIWGEDKMISRTWKYAAPLILDMPDDILEETAHSVTRWLKNASEDITIHEDILIRLCHKFIKLEISDQSAVTTRNGQAINEPVMEALNHPIGHVTEALISLWFKNSPNDNDLLPENIKPLFTSICDTQISRFRHGRVILASRLIALFRVDREWTRQYVLPVFNWQSNPTEAKGAWEGFLWAPRLYDPLLIEMKQQLLDSARHYTDLGKHSSQFASFLTFVALEPPEGYSDDDFRTAFDVLPNEGLVRSALALKQALEGAGDQSEEYWLNRIVPFWQKIWPKSKERITENISSALVNLVVAARGNFPQALELMKDWLKPLKHDLFVPQKLTEYEICSQYPEDTLKFLTLITNTNRSWVHKSLEECLTTIKQAQPQLTSTLPYKELLEYYRRVRPDES